MSGGSSTSIGDAARFGVITVSDRASTGVYNDLSGPAILQFFAEAVESPWQAEYRLVPDEQPLIEQAIIDLVRARSRCGHAGLPCHCSPGAAQHAAPRCSLWMAAQVDNQGCCLVVTTGGTGPAPRDVTPEATEAVCQRMMPGCVRRRVRLRSWSSLLSARA